MTTKIPTLIHAGDEAWKFHIWKQVYHNGAFHHTLERDLIVHATDETWAKIFASATLQPGEKTEASNLKIVVTEEYIHSSHYLGKVDPIMTFEYRKSHAKE